MKTLRIYFTGVGGQGNVLATKLLGEAALLASVPVAISETHGMAQRGGVVESMAVLGGAQSPIIADNEADVLLAFEPLEAVRALSKIHENGVVVISTAPLPPFSVAAGKGVYPAMDDILSRLAGKASRVIALNARQEAERAGNPLGANMVMLGALFATGLLPIPKEALRSAIEKGSKPAFVAVNLECFERGCKAADLNAA